MHCSQLSHLPSSDICKNYGIGIIGRTTAVRLQACKASVTLLVLSKLFCLVFSFLSLKFALNAKGKTVPLKCTGFNVNFFIQLRSQYVQVVVSSLTFYTRISISPICPPSVLNELDGFSYLVLGIKAELLVASLVVT